MIVIFRLFKSICFLLNEFHCTFCISFQIYIVVFTNIVFLLGSNRPSVHFPFLPALLYFFPYSRFSSYLLRLSLCLISFLLFDARVFGKTLVHEIPISYSHTEWHFVFSLFDAREAKHVQWTLL